MHAQRAINEEPIPGYRLLAPLGSGGFGEVWKCEAPGGLCKAIKFVSGSSSLEDSGAASKELRSLQRIKSIRHPFLLSIERVELIGGNLVIVTELADKSLHDLLQEHRAADRPGVPRQELLAYLGEAAEVLDLMNQEHGLQHLDVKPRNLFLVGRHLKVADFGLVNSLAELSGSAGANLLGAITPLYAAPETFANRVTAFTDQYSLAVSFMELLTGTLPYKGKNMRQLMLQVTTAEPDLSALGEADRAIVGRALSREPDERFASCQEFVEALAEVPFAPSANGGSRPSTTSFEFSLGEMANTAMLPANGSGLLRRKSRIMTPPRPIADAAKSEDVLAGYRLLECLNRGGLGELWKSVGPHDEPYLVRFVALPDGSREVPVRLASLRHPMLPVTRLLEAGPGRLALISGSGDTSLAGRLKECLASGQPGIPRDELLQYLAQYADALDELYQEHQMQHLALSPRHLALCQGEPLLLEFGIAELLMLPLGQPPASLNPRYAAVEQFDGLISDACDQYSLALIYQELLVGLHPFRNLNARQMASAKLRGQPELSLLPAPDRAVVLRALSAEPEKRFRSCREFVLALEEIAGHAPAAGQGGRGGPPLADEWASAIDELVHAAGRGHLIEHIGQLYYRLTLGVEIAQYFWARLPPGMSRLKMAGFVEQHKAEVLEKSESRWLVEVPTKTTLWQRCLGKTPGLLLEVTLGRPRESHEGQTPVRVRIEPRDCGRGKAEQLLADLGPAILASLQTYFGGESTRQEQERFPLAQPVHVQVPGGVSITARTRELHREGMVLLSPCALPFGPLYLTLNRWASPVTVQVPGQVCHCVPSGEGEYEVEVRFDSRIPQGPPARPKR